MATRDRILEKLAGGGRFTTAEMIEAVGGSYAAVHTSLRRLQRARKVDEIVQIGGKKLRETLWGLPFAATAVPATPVAKPGTYAQAQSNVPPPAKKLRTKAILVVDLSGSMDGYQYEMADAINKTLGDLRSEAFRTGQAIDVSLYYFSNYRVRNVFRDVDARDVKAEPVQRPDGGTPLFNAVEDAINDHIRPEREDEEVAYLVITITDGDNNQSRDNTGETMKSLIRRVNGTDRWTVTFQMPPNTKAAFCRKYGIHPGNCVEWERSSRGIQEATTARTASVSNYLGLRSKGVNAMETFYTDLSAIDTKDLKKSLRNIQDQVKTFPVPSGSPEIRPFIEQKTGRVYETGSAFYQLTKPEKVQDTKKILIKEKNGRAIYAGDEARTLLGLPIGKDCRVRPGNHANFDLFVESTSVNRKLVQGTVVVHWPVALQ
jgi:Mg-chelatase subunit ChlD